MKEGLATSGCEKRTEERKVFGVGHSGEKKEKLRELAFFFLLGFDRENVRKVGIILFFLVCFKEEGSLGHSRGKRE